MIDQEVDEPFIAMVKSQCLRPGPIKEQGKTLSVVYTPLNGAGAIPVERVLAELGIRVTFVPEQQKPDGNFPTVKFRTLRKHRPCNWPSPWGKHGART